MPTATVVSDTTIRTVELKVSDAPPLKCDYVYYDVTGLRITYQDDKLTKLTVIGICSDTQEEEEVSTRLEAYDMVQPWIREEVEKNRPSTLRAREWRLAADAVDSAFHGEPFLNYPPDFADLLRAEADKFTT